MDTINKVIPLKSANEEIKIVPLGDIHLGTRACDEDLLNMTVRKIKESGAYWIGMGDYCEYINRKDKRFDPTIIAPWINVYDLKDIARVQSKKVIDILKPIAKQCIGLIEGTHEMILEAFSERDIYSEIIMGIKDEAGMGEDDKLKLGFYGWLNLHFSSGTRRAMVSISAMHGARASELAGAKALNMQRWLWTHGCDIALIGHNHSSIVTREVVEEINHLGEVKEKIRYGCYTGSFYRTNLVGYTTYAERKQLLPLPLGGVEITIKPFAQEERDKIRISQ